MSKNGECPALPVNPLPQPRAVKGRRRIELLMQPDQISAQRLCQGQEQRAQLRGMISVKWFERLDLRVWFSMRARRRNPLADALRERVELDGFEQVVVDSRFQTARLFRAQCIGGNRQNGQ